MRFLLIVALLLCCIQSRSAIANTLAQDARLLPCSERPTSLSEPWIKAGSACLEQVINDPAGGALAFTALATAPDGTLYAARPLQGEVYALTDTDGDLLPDTPHVIAAGLTFPNGLTFADDALYISGGAHIYRWREGELTPLVDDLPSGAGFWTGGIVVADDRIYVATGAPCDFCVPDDPARGAVLSFALDGTDRRVMATGLRQPVDLAWFDGALWVTDTARSGLFDTPDLDEIDRVEPDVNFGFPYCVGDNVADMSGFDCAQATAPAVSLPTASTPTGIAAYQSDVLPALQGKLLVVLNGSYNDLDLRGYSVVAVDPRDASITPLIPARPDDSAASDFTIQQMSYRGSGFYPQRPLDVAVTPQGWVYVSITDGRILALRPLN